MRVINETWLDSFTPLTVTKLTGNGTFRMDRTVDSSKKCGGGLCVFVSTAGVLTVVKGIHCSLDMVQCRPFYHPRKFMALVITAVYVPP